MSEYGAATGAHLLIGLGGTIDGFAGRVKRAPRWMQRAGLEWFYRLITLRRFKRMARLPLVLVYAHAQRRREKRHA